MQKRKGKEKSDIKGTRAIPASPLPNLILEATLMGWPLVEGTAVGLAGAEQLGSW